jgi:hypothetical protein
MDLDVSLWRSILAADASREQSPFVLIDGLRHFLNCLVRTIVFSFQRLTSINTTNITKKLV